MKLTAATSLTAWSTKSLRRIAYGNKCNQVFNEHAINTMIMKTCELGMINRETCRTSVGDLNVSISSSRLDVYRCKTAYPETECLRSRYKSTFIFIRSRTRSPDKFQWYIIISTHRATRRNGILLMLRMYIRKTVCFMRTIFLCKFVCLVNELWFLLCNELLMNLIKFVNVHSIQGHDFACVKLGLKIWKVRW